MTTGVRRTAWIAALALAAACATTEAAMDWTEIQQAKQKNLALAAQHAMEQQKTTAAEPVKLAVFATAEPAGAVEITRRTREELSLVVQASPRTGREAAERVRLTLPRPIDMIAAHSGLAVVVRTGAGSSEEVRVGLRLIGAGDAGRAVVLPMIPAVNAFGDRSHELYFDWAFLNFRHAADAIRALRAVEAVEITFASARRAPARGAADGAREAVVSLSDLRLVDYLKGSFDPSRCRWQAENRKPDLTLQHRCQEVTGVVARFGGQAGARAAADSLDMAARTQCWDGSFLDCRRGPTTVASGEYTFGFTLYGLLCGYQTLAETNSPLLRETVRVGGAEMTRRAACQRMLYRGAMARTAALPSAYRDDIIGGDTLMFGANRVLGYAIAMRLIADLLDDKARADEVLDAYKPIMSQIADAQGKYSGGFPILGEGDRYAGKGLHYDGGYIRTHMDWLVVGAVRTGDPLLVRMLRNYQVVFNAAMNERGLGIKKLLSERHPGGSDVALILPHATYQAGLKYKLPIIAQWGYNVGRHAWGGDTPANHFTFASHARGYSLGAHISILFDDLAAEPVPADPGYLFPRQYPVWSSRLYTKDGALVRTSRVTIQPDGARSDDFRIEVGEYPVTVGVPVRVRGLTGPVHATAVSLDGWPKLLPADAEIQLGGDLSARARVGRAITVNIDGPTRITLAGPDLQLPPIAGGQTVPFAAEFILDSDPQPVELTILRGAH